MNIAGVLVHAMPGRMHDVEKALQDLGGVEVHASHDNGRFVVTVEEDDREIVSGKLLAIHGLDGVLSASLAYQYSEDDET